jgi:trimethylamine--corrinoid protein Co-methyltransferase
LNVAKPKGLIMEFKVLTDKQIEQIHNASIKILGTTGIQISHSEVLQRFKEAGAEVDESRERVRIPEKLVMDSIEKCGKKFSIYGRDRNKKARFGFGERNYNSIAGEAHWVDDLCLTRRPASLDDVAISGIVGDALENINVVGAMSDPKELPVNYRCVEVAAQLLRNTTKPITFWFYDRKSAKYVLELFSAIAGSENEAIKYPYGYPFLEPISPLKFPFHGIDLLFETCKFPLPVPIGPMAQVGATAPGTLAGTLAQENAEILAGTVIVQLIKPGTPVCYGGIPHAFDMRTTQLIFSGPEQALMAVAMTQMGKHYGLPIYINVGLTDSKTVDAQAGIEAGITLVLGALSGADIFGHLGISGVDQASSLAMLVMQDEVIGYVERIMRGFEVSDETLGLDVIDSVVSEGGTFLSQDHTVRHFRKELWFPTLLDRRYWQAWRDDNAEDMMQRCIEKKNMILKNHKPEPIDADTEKEIDKVLSHAKRELTG